MGANTQTTSQNQQQFTSPWLPTIGSLQDIIGRIGGGGTPLTGAQQSALGTLQAGAASIPQLGDTATPAVTNLLNGSVSNPGVGLLNNAYGTMQNTLAPYLSSGYTNPFNTPGFSDALNQVNRSITNQVNSQFAGAGRFGGGSAGGSGTANASNPNFLSYSLAGAEAPLIAQQYNANVGQQQGAANALLSGANTTAAGTTNLPIAALMAGLQGAGQLPGLYTAPGAAQLNAANIGAQLPYEMTALPENLLTQIAGLGGQGVSSGTSTTTQPINPWSTGIGAGLFGLGLLGQFSDARLKENIERIGTLDNGLPIYRYNFKGSRKLEIGVIAQDVEKVMPEAVSELNGYKVVNYDLATRAA